MTRRTPVWEAPDEILDLMGPMSGNELNGWDEPDVRPPTLVMWANPNRIAHGAVQQKMTEDFLEHPELRTVLRTNDRHEPVAVADESTERTPDAWVTALAEFAGGEAGHQVEQIAITRPDPSWFFEGRAAEAPWVVLLVVAMDHEELNKAPDHPSAMEVHRQYNRGTAAARAMADWIRSEGYWAEGHGGPGAGPLQMVPAALAAGLGELGKHGSIIHPVYGSSFRLAAVLTDAPLTTNVPDRFGADEFCQGCRICTDACPPDAIAPEKRLVRGVDKWAVDFDRCLPYFAVSHGCGICIAVCPWSKPGAAPRLADNMRRKLAR